MATLSKPLDELLKSYSAYLLGKRPSSEETKIEVDEIALKIASFYEKFRNLIDYQEKHLLRKNVIGRALRRRIFLKDVSGEDVAEPLIKEVIRSGYLGNNWIPARKIGEVQLIIDNLLFFSDHAKTSSIPMHEDFPDWLLGVTVCAIEECLAPPEKNRMLAQMMLNTLRGGLEIRGGTIPQADQDALLFIAVQKSLFRVDNDQLSYRLLQLLSPAWESTDLRNTSPVTNELLTAHERISHYLRHPLLPLFLKACNHYNTVFQMLGSLVFGSKGVENLDRDIEAAYEDRLRKERGKLSRMAFLSILSFFLSKILVAIAIEVPIDLYIVGRFSLVHATLNIVFPPILMLLIVASIRLPSRKNLHLIREEMKAVIFEHNAHPYVIQIPKKKSWFISFLLSFSYLAIFFVTIRIIADILLSFGFSIANIVVFILFTSLVTAVGVKIYNRSKEMCLEKDPPRFFSFLLDLFTLPLVTIGRWIISGFRRFNVFVIFVNVFIEFPFQLIVEFLENLHDFIRTKKEEIQ
ncbi:MAG: hypothetical protein Q8R20_00090 [Nanoarchaeota archaeon]|nr:hypothetical protein [Nanoarchaeota archaeon]